MAKRYKEYRYSTRSYEAQKAILRALENWIRPGDFNPRPSHKQDLIACREVAKLTDLIEKRLAKWKQRLNEKR